MPFGLFKPAAQRPRGPISRLSDGLVCTASAEKDDDNCCDMALTDNVVRGRVGVGGCASPRGASS